MKKSCCLDWSLRTFAIAAAVFIMQGVSPAWAATDLKDGAVGWHWLTPTNVYAGNTVFVQGAVSNAGSTACSAFYIGVYLSSDTTINTSDRYMGRVTNSGLGAWSSKDFLNGGFRVPADTPSGTYYVGYIIDSSGIITESNEGNNTGVITSPRLVVLNWRPDTPTGVSPANGATGQSLTPTLTASAFHDNDVGDTHAASLWIVDDNSDWSSPVYATGETTLSKTSLAIPSGALSASKKYYWTVAYKDSSGSWSYHSSARYFTTASGGGTVVYPIFDASQPIAGNAVNRWSFMTAWNLATGVQSVSPSWQNGSYTWNHPAAGYQQWIARFAYDQVTGKTTSLAWYYRQAHVQ